MVTIIGTDVTAKGLAQLGVGRFACERCSSTARGWKMPMWRNYRSSSANVKIDYRRGGLLGVRGTEGAQSAEVQSVQPGTARRRRLAFCEATRFARSTTSRSPTLLN